MIKIYTTLLLLLITVGSNAQQTEWIASNPIQWSLNPGMITQCVDVSANGNIISSRTDTSHLNYNQDVFGTNIIECRDVAANVLWSFKLADSVVVHFIETDMNNDIYVAGSFLGTANLNGVDTINIDSPAAFQENEFILKLSPGGSLIWKFNATVNNYYPRITAMTCDQQNNFWFCTSNFIDSRIYKMGNAGSPVDSVLINDSRSLSGIAIDAFGAIYICGAAGSPSMYIGDSLYNVSEAYAMYIARLRSSSYAVDWIYFGHDVTFQSPQVMCDGHGGVYFAGNLMDSIAWGNITFPHPQWNSDFFLVRADSSGNFIWGRHTSVTPTIVGSFSLNNGSRFFDHDAMNNVFLAGTLNGSVDWGNGVVVQGQIGTDNIHVVSFDENNTALWQKTAKSMISFPTSISVSNTNDVYLAASTRDTCTMDTITVNSGGDLANLVVKISYASVGIENVRNISSSVYPNPAIDFVNVPARWNGQRVDVVDLNGRLIQSSTAESRIELKVQSPGIYILRCNSESARLIIMN